MGMNLAGDEKAAAKGRASEHSSAQRTIATVMLVASLNFAILRYGCFCAKRQEKGVFQYCNAVMPVLQERTRSAVTSQMRPSANVQTSVRLRSWAVGARGDRRSGARPCRAQALAWISSRLSMPLCTLVATFLRPLPAHRNMARREALQLGRLLKMEAEKTGQMVPGRC